MANAFDQFDVAGGGGGAPAAPAATNPFDQFQPPAPEKPELSFGTRAAHGFADPLVGSAQFYAKAGEALGPAANLLPGGHLASLAAPAIDKFTRERETEYEGKRRAAGQSGVDWARVLGSIANPVNYAAPGVGAGGGIMSTLGRSALSGASAAGMEPIEKGADFWREKLKGMGIGGAVGGALGPALSVAGRGARRAYDFVADRFKDPAERAAADIASRLQRGARTGGSTAEEALTAVSDANKQGTPLALVDVSRELRDKGGTVFRAPGEGRGIATGFLEERQKAAKDRLNEIIDREITSGPSARASSHALVEQRSAQARPLYAKAEEGPGLASLETEFTNQWGATGKAAREAEQDVAKAEGALTQAKARQATAGNVYSSSGANTGARKAEQQLAQANTRLAEANAEKEAAASLMRRAQEDGTLYARGAVWSPYLERLRGNGLVKQGLARGWKIEKNNADGSNIPFRPSEYAVISEDATGEPIVGAVPNMRLWMVAKEGLDAIIEEHTDKLTGRPDKFGNSVINLLKGGVGEGGERQFGLLRELDRLNPDYKAAREAWAGPSASMQNVRFGKSIFDRTPEETRELMQGLTASEREFVKLGVADTLRERLAKAGFGGDQSRAVLRNPWMEQHLEAILPDAKARARFVDAVMAEHTMAETAGKTMSGSQSAERLAQDLSPEALRMGHDAASFGHHALRGNVFGATAAAVRAAKDLLSRQDPKLNRALAERLFNKDISPNDPLGQAILNYRYNPTLIAPGGEAPYLSAITGAAAGR